MTAGTKATHEVHAMAVTDTCHPGAMTKRYSVAVLRRSLTGTLRFDLLPLFDCGRLRAVHRPLRPVRRPRHGVRVIAEPPGAGLRLLRSSCSRPR
jgi:hypothetical protein